MVMWIPADILAYYIYVREKKIRISTWSNRIHFGVLFVHVSCNCNRKLHGKVRMFTKKHSAIVSQPDAA